MKFNRFLKSTVYVALTIGIAFQSSLSAQQSSAASRETSSLNSDSPIVPRAVKFGGTLRDASGNARTGFVGVLFSIYDSQNGGAAVWQETQTVKLDEQGRYNVLLGSSRNEGLPTEIFSANEARWLGIQVMADGEAEQPRVILVSVPYALKAQDSETLGGRPASAYMLADQFAKQVAAAETQGTKTQASAAGKESSAAYYSPDIIGTAAENMLAKFSGASLSSSSISEKEVPVLDEAGNFVRNETRVGFGLGSSNPNAKLDVNGDMKASGLTIESASASGPAFNNSLTDGNGLQVLASGSGYSYGVFSASTSSEGAGVVGIGMNTTEAVAGKESYGVAGLNLNAYGTGVFAWSKNGSNQAFPQASSPAGLFAVVDGSNGIAAIAESRNAQSKIFSGRYNGTEKISMTNSGDVVASGVVTAAGFARAAGAASCPANKVMTGLDGLMNPVCTDNMTAGSLTIESTQVNGPTFSNRLADGNGLQVFATGSGYSYGVFAVSESAQGAGVVGIASNSANGVQGQESYGVAGMSHNAYGSGLFGWSKYQSSGALLAMPVADAPAGVFAVADGSTSVAGIFDARNALAKIFSGRYNGTEKISMNTSGDIAATGTVTAQAFKRSNATSCAATTVVTGLDSNLNPVCTSLATGVVLGAASQTYVNNAIAASEAAASNKVAMAQTEVKVGDTLNDGGTFATNYTIAADAITVGSVIEVSASGIIRNANGQNLAGFGLKLGNTNLLPELPTYLYDAKLGWRFEAKLICTGVSGSTATFEVQGTQQIGAQFETLDNEATVSVELSGTPVLSVLQTAQALQVNGQPGTTATMRQLIVKSYR